MAVAALLTGWLVAGCTGDVPVVRIEAQPSPTESSAAPSIAPSPSPTTSESPTPSATPTDQVPRPATDTDRARFVADFHPEGASGLEHVAADLDGDGTAELLFTYLRAGRTSHIDVAWWTGTAYAVQFADDGGEASRIDRVRVDDVNADGLTELVVRQSGDGTSTASLWQVTGPGQVARLRAQGGCFAGSHTYGTTQVRFEDRDADGAEEVYADCPDGTTVRYRWDAGTYRHDPALEP